MEQGKGQEQTNPNEGTSRRNPIRNTLNLPWSKLRPAIPAVAIGCLFLAILLVFIGLKINELITTVALYGASPQDAAQLTEPIRLVLVISFCSIMVSFISIVLLVSMWITYRHRGPEVALRKQLRRLIEGDYSTEMKLRDGDVFTDLESDLNELTRQLKAKS